jgi:hypothetical protein
MFLIDFEQGRIIDNDEVKSGDRLQRKPYGQSGGRSSTSTMDDLEKRQHGRNQRREEAHHGLGRTTPRTSTGSGHATWSACRLFGYTQETLQMLMLLPLVKDLKRGPRLHGQRRGPGRASRTSRV